MGYLAFKIRRLRWEPLDDLFRQLWIRFEVDSVSKVNA